jgi:hypothetical protein
MMLSPARAHSLSTADMAASPSLVTHGLTLKGAQLNWAILQRRKTVENRSIRLPPGWIVLHTGVGKLDPVRSAEIAVQCPDIPPEATLPHGVIVGAMRVDRACTVADCAATPAAPWAHGPICNVIGAVVRLTEPVPHKGSLGLWPLSADVLPHVRSALDAAPVLENDPAVLPTAAPGTSCKPRVRGAPKRKRESTSGSSAAGSAAAPAVNGSTIDAHFAASRPRAAAPPPRELLTSKLMKLVPGTSEAAAHRALQESGDNLCAAKYTLSRRSV